MPHMSLSPLPAACNDANFLRRLRAIAADSAQVVITTHAKMRMRQRKASMSQVLACLRKGSVRESAALTISGDWKASVGHSVAGDEIQVAVVLERDADGDLCVVITVMN